MFVWWMTALAAPPEMAVAWDKHQAWLEVVAPEGTGIEPLSLVTVDLGYGDYRLRVETSGTDLLDAGVALPLGIQRGTPQGQVDLTLCAKADGTCTPTQWMVHTEGAVAGGKKGRIDLLVRPALVVEAGPADEPVFNTDRSDDLGEAFARAERENKDVLLDFSAVWCPPCNLLSAEVLHADPPPAALDEYVVVVVDVDHPSSFDAKSRYGVGGYPTVVITSPDGTEKSRRVGYQGREPFVDWLVQAHDLTDAADLEAGADEVSPERALELAWALLADRRFDEAAPFVERGKEVDSALARRVRATVDPTEADVRWLLANDVDAIGDWFGVAMDLTEAHPELAREVADLAVRRLTGPPLADALYVQGKVLDDPSRYAVAASVLRTTFSGDGEHDRGHYTWLASLLQLSGDLPGALSFLDEARGSWSDEPTWDLHAAYLLAGAERHEEALEVARRAKEVAWGDNALRVAQAEAKALLALGRRDEAEAVVAEALEAPAPPDDLAVRTHRYRERLAELLEPSE